MSTNLAQQFPKVEGWVTSQAHYFAPVDLSVEGQRAMASYLVKHDTVLTKIIRENCARRWGIALRIGKRTVHMRIFDLDTARSDVVPYTGCEGSIFKVIDKRLSMHDASVEETREVMQCRPILYADRALTKAEEKFMDDIASIYPIKAPIARELAVA